MNTRAKSRQEQRVDKVLGRIVMCAAAVAVLYAPANVWAYALAFCLIFFTIGSLPVLGALPGLKAAANEQRVLFHGLLLSGLIGAAVVSGLHVVLTIAVVVGSFFYLRGSKAFAEMREYMPGTSATLEAIALVIVLIAACLLTLSAGEGRSMGAATMWFIGLAVLFPATFGMGWVWNTIGVANDANKAVTERIKVTLHEAGIPETAKNIAEVRKVGGDRMASTEREEAAKKFVTVDLMHAALGKAPLIYVGVLALIPAIFMLGPVILNCSVYPAWWYVAVKSHRPARVDDFVRGIRVL